MLAGLFSRSYIFAGVFSITAILVFYYLLKFLRRNTL
jgi:hypothetical protein